MTYPKVMTAGPNQSVVVANEEQERALPKEYGGLAGKGGKPDPAQLTGAEQGAPVVHEAAAPVAETAKATTSKRKKK